MDLGTALWLAGPEAAEALALAAEQDAVAHARAAAGAAGAADPLAAATSLRRALPALDPGRAAAVLTQVRLRRRARPRLGPLTDRLLLTEDGAEQATRTVVADLRAARYAAAGATRVADLGAGLGLDALALARAGLAVTAVERDPVVAALARANAAACGVADRVEVREGDVTDPAVLDAALADADAAYADPARRDPARTRGGRSARVGDPAAWSPPWEWVVALGARVPRTAVKVAPGVPHELTPAGGLATWTSVDGDLVECELAWPGLRLPEDGADVRRARVLRGGAVVTLGAAHALADQAAPPVGEAGTWVHEPDDAVIRAGLVAEVAGLIDGRLLDPQVAYVTTDADRDVAPLTARFRVRAVLPYDVGALRAHLVDAGVGRVVVKKRATSLEPDDVRRRLTLPPAPGTATVLLTRVGTRTIAIVADPA